MAESVTVDSAKGSATTNGWANHIEQPGDVEHTIDMPDATFFMNPEPVPHLDLNPGKNAMMEVEAVLKPALTSMHDEVEMEAEPSEPEPEVEEIVSKKTVIGRDYLAMWAAPPGRTNKKSDAS